MFFIFHFKMNQEQFIREFMAYYDICGEYDITMAFELFYEEELVQKNKIEELFKIHFPTNNINTDEHLLYDKLYNIVEPAVINNCESEADTDKDEE
jgi:hypothetical protein